MRLHRYGLLLFAISRFTLLAQENLWEKAIVDPETGAASVHKYFLERYRNWEKEHPSATIAGLYTIQPLNIAGKTTNLSKEVFGYLPYWFRDRWNLLDYSLVSTIAYFSGEANPDGTIFETHGWPKSVGDPSASSHVINMINAAHNAGVKVVLCITNFSGLEISSIVGTPSYREAFIDRAYDLVVAGNADGININFEGISNSSRDDLTAFMKALADTFHTRMPGSQVSCAPTDFDLRPGDWDVAALEPYVDLFFFQGYGYHFRSGSRAGPVGLLPNNAFWGSLNITTLIDVVLSRIGTTKAIIGLPHFGYRWPTNSGNLKASTEGDGVAIYYPDALATIATRGRQWDANSLNAWYKFQDGSQWFQGWYDDPESMEHKYQFALNRNLAGIGMWSLGQDGSNHDIWDVLAIYFADSSSVLRAPHQPTLAAVVDNSGETEGRVVVRWFANTEPQLGGYRLFISSAPSSFSPSPVLDESVLDKNTIEAEISSLSRDSSYYVRLVAVDTSGTKPSDVSDTYGVRLGSGPRYLIVDGFDRQTASYYQPQHEFVASYGDPVASNSRYFDSADNDALINGLISLSSYDGVVWFLGDDSRTDRTFDLTEQSLVKSYLEQGGKLFVSGSEAGYDLGTSASSNYSPAFYNGYLKAVYRGDKAAGTAASGLSGTIFDGISVTFGEVYEEDWPDYIDPTGGSIVNLRYNASQNAGIQYEGLFGDGTVPGKLVYIGFSVETIASAAARQAMLEAVLDFFESVTSIDMAEQIPTEFRLLQNYPNPFNPVTSIEYHLPSESHVTLRVYDTVGRLVSTLVDERKTADRYTVEFDGAVLASGIYFYRVEAGQNVATRKMLLLK